MALHKPIDIPLPPTNNWVTKQRVENTVVIFADLSGFQQFAADYGSTDAAESPDFHGRRTWGVLKG